MLSTPSSAAQQTKLPSSECRKDQSKMQRNLCRTSGQRMGCRPPCFPRLPHMAQASRSFRCRKRFGHWTLLVHVIWLSLVLDMLRHRISLSLHMWHMHPCVSGIGHGLGIGSCSCMVQASDGAFCMGQCTGMHMSGNAYARQWVQLG